MITDDAIYDRGEAIVVRPCVYIIMESAIFFEMNGVFVKGAYPIARNRFLGNVATYAEYH
ncbi:hypothetical protein FLA_0771 [Filimonas lacunae]|nr:hypothetical protein FLA_0771 [Filimonas lacunae]